MAILIPTREEIYNLPQKPEEGEMALMEALCQALDDSWTVYFQPHLNGLKPDIIIFSEDGGIGIFEVKDWDLNNHKIESTGGKGYEWKVKAWDTGKWHQEYSPFKQVEKYKQSIFKYEIPILGAKQIIDKSIYSLIQPFVYFHKHTTKDVSERLKNILNNYSNVFGYDDLQPDKLRIMLAKRYLKSGSKFARLMKEIGLADRLANALAYPKHGYIDIQNLLKPLSKKQSELVDRASGAIRIKGAAGAGKTFVLVHKAVNAARKGKQVLLVCFNITMVNYLRDLVTCLARYYGKQDNNFNYHRYIEVGHFHRLFPYPEKDNRNMKVPVDVLLIDEGQDFQRSWIESLQKVCANNYHFVFCEDRRQNIYSTEAVPIGAGRPNELNDSYRIPEQTAKLANFLSNWAEQEGMSETVTSVKPIQNNLFIHNVWCDGTQTDINNALREDIKNLVEDRNTARADIAILVCTIKAGWYVCRLLDELSLPYQRTFESYQEYCELEKRYENNSEELIKKKEALRRGYKCGFWMQTGKIKVSTIHSFKGWELSNILVLFAPVLPQEGDKISLLYTAITRSQERLTIYNYNPELSVFGRKAISEGYIEEHPSTTSIF